MTDSSTRITCAGVRHLHQQLGKNPSQYNKPAVLNPPPPAIVHYRSEVHFDFDHNWVIMSESKYQTREGENCPRANGIKLDVFHCFGLQGLSLPSWTTVVLDRVVFFCSGEH